MKNIIQIAGVRGQHDLDILLSSGVDYIGFPFRLAFHQEDISENEAARLIRQIPQTTKAVLITYLSESSQILKLSEFLKVKAVQIHGDISPEELKMLRAGTSHVELFKSLIIGRESVSELEEHIQQYSPFIDAFITDTFDPESGAQGATGKIHDWQISRHIVERSAKPVILAGGLNPANIKKAIELVRPAGVDAHTGVEDQEGNKDPKKVKQFVSISRQSFRELP